MIFGIITNKAIIIMYGAPRRLSTVPKTRDSIITLYGLFTLTLFSLLYRSTTVSRGFGKQLRKTYTDRPILSAANM